MFFRGKNIDPVRLWSDYCDLADNDTGPFLSLCYCPNPGHPNSRTPAFQINVERPLVHCFSNCGISGSYEHALCVIEGLYAKYDYDEELNEKAGREKILQNQLRKKKAYREARKIIYRKALEFGKVGVKRNVLPAATKLSRVSKTKRVEEINLADYSYLPKEARDFLASRGIDSSSRATWQLGFNEKTKRITIPVFDKRNRLKFVIERGIHRWQRPAYLYPDESDKSACLYGICALDLAVVRSEGLIVVEGSLDAILMRQAGFQNVVGVLGAYISNKQRELIAQLRPSRIITFFDNDAAGVRATEKAAQTLSMYSIFAAQYPKNSFGKDPASLSNSERKTAVRKAIPLLRVKKKLREAKLRV